MRIECPQCGARDVREFTYLGAAVLADRPDADATTEAWQDYVHLRDNPAGPHDELWHHAMGCSAWLRVRRNTLTHEILTVTMAQEDRT
ncbi:sarcosine oxidase subunit delta [Pontivivens insulae]|uniref:Sarcosine oxidase subunit delta n=1 Tax=Pontivivens insulae TaxID=1639689 RepID=A0A2R8AEX1_9RHOB|nr:sarcosine oxidase subunit delta [Pontivivens insulae]RED11833.1 heterotetrameric sarcosine oxidase delta subunit [Pontivivens insulae]SPF30590.1 Sarcosine oxidase subunit delta [Pontivivens insulae]